MFNICRLKLNIRFFMWHGKDRRKSADWVSVTINTLNIVSWFVLLVALIIFHYARPEMEYFVYQLVEQQVQVRTSWLTELKTWLELTLYFCLTLGVSTILLNQTRLKRRTDRQRYNVYMLVLISLVFVTYVTAS